MLSFKLSQPKALTHFKELVEISSEVHPGGFMSDYAKQVLKRKAKHMNIHPRDRDRIFAEYKFFPPEWDERWISITEDKFPRWKFIPGQPEPGTIWKEPLTGMEFVWVPGGEYVMGDLFEEGYVDETPVHEVEVDGFWLGRFPVTQEEWQIVMESMPEMTKTMDRYPMVNITWDETQIFCQTLMAKSEGSFRLPTEGEWEYASRSGGKQERYAGGNKVDRVAWYFKNSGDTTHCVGEKLPNGLGLYDMSGNVWEWVSDWYCDVYYRNSPKKNPQGPIKKGAYRVTRGGSWNGILSYVRCADRDRSAPGFRGINLGFRLVKSYSETTNL